VFNFVRGIMRVWDPGVCGTLEWMVCSRTLIRGSIWIIQKEQHVEASKTAVEILKKVLE
jgi:hypothetical protein